MLTASRPADLQSAIPNETNLNLYHQDDCTSPTMGTVHENYINYPWISKERSSSRRQRQSHQSGKILKAA
jgi:hypothetical protein